MLAALLRDIQATADNMQAVDGLADMGTSLAQVVAQGEAARQWLLDHAGEDRYAAGSASVNYLMLLGYLCGGWVMGQAALKAQALLDAGQGDKGFLETKRVTARFYFEHLLPRASACLAAVEAGSSSVMALAPEQF